jgi:hypothetical protein
MQPSNLPRTVLAEARQLVAQARYAEALEKYLWFHRHALEYHEALAGVRLSFALSEWFELGQKYPPARRALLSTRDEAAAAVERGEGTFQLFHDAAAINRALGADAKTVRLFKEAHHRDPELAERCYHAAEPVLAAHGEYATCVHFIPDLEKRLDAIRQLHRMTLELAEESPTLSRPEAGLKEYAAIRLAQETGRLIEILEGVGRTQDADRVREFVREMEQE